MKNRGSRDSRSWYQTNFWALPKTVNTLLKFHGEEVSGTCRRSRRRGHLDVDSLIDVSTEESCLHV